MLRIPKAKTELLVNESLLCRLSVLHIQGSLTFPMIRAKSISYVMQKKHRKTTSYLLDERCPVPPPEFMQNVENPLDRFPASYAGSETSFQRAINSSSSIACGRVTFAVFDFLSTSSHLVGRASAAVASMLRWQPRRLILKAS